MLISHIIIPHVLLRRSWVSIHPDHACCFEAVASAALRTCKFFILWRARSLRHVGHWPRTFPTLLTCSGKGGRTDTESVWMNCLGVLQTYVSRSFLKATRDRFNFAIWLHMLSRRFAFFWWDFVSMFCRLYNQWQLLPRDQNSRCRLWVPGTYFG